MPDTGINLAGARLINVGQPDKSITITIKTDGNGEPKYQIEHHGILAADQAMLVHELIDHFSYCIKDANSQLAMAHQNMLQFMAAEQAKRETVVRI